MEMFNTHRRDILSFDNYMDLKKPGFGGPKSAIALRDERGRKINKDPKLADYQRTVERDPAFSNQVYNPTYKAMTHDLVYKQENKKPFKYTDPYRTAVPVIEYDPTSEGKTYSSFNRYINEMEERPLEDIESDLRSYEEEEEEEYGTNPEEEDDLKNFAAKLPPQLGKPDKNTMMWLKSLEAGANPSDADHGYGMYPEVPMPDEISDYESSNTDDYDWERWENQYGMYGANPEEGDYEGGDGDEEGGDEDELADVTVNPDEADPFSSEGWDESILGGEEEESE